MAADLTTTRVRRFGDAWRAALRPWRDARGTQARWLTMIGAGIVLAFVLMAAFAPQLATHDPERRTRDYTQPPSREHFFGTTHLSFDVWSQSVYGARIALQVVLVATVFSVVVAVPLGLWSGYRGGWLDRTLVLAMDSIYAFPGLLLAIVIQSLFRPGALAESLDAWAQGPLAEALVALPAGALRVLASTPVFSVAVAISVVYVPQYFRVVRNHVASVKEEAYVEAARAIGAPPRSIVWRYVFFNVVQTVPVILTLNAADAILTLAGLGYLGYGVPPPTPEWGYSLKEAASEIANTPPIWWTSFFPGALIVLLVLGVTLLGEGLNDVWNPVLRERRKS